MTILEIRRLARVFGADVDCSPESILSRKYGSAIAIIRPDDLSRYCLFDNRLSQIKLVPDWTDWVKGDCADAIATIISDSPEDVGELAKKVREAQYAV
jgi:hypothetical protein